MRCSTKGSEVEVEPEAVQPGIVRCPECGATLDEDTLDPLPREERDEPKYHRK